MYVCMYVCMYVYLYMYVCMYICRSTLNWFLNCVIFLQWTRPSVSCGPCNKLDIWYCFVLALCVFIILGFVILQHRYDVSQQIETTVIFASIYVLCGMIIMMKVRYFWTWFIQRSFFWGNWKNLNEEWRIVEVNEHARTPESPVWPTTAWSWKYTDISQQWCSHKILGSGTHYALIYHSILTQQIQRFNVIGYKISSINSHVYQYINAF